MYCLVEKLKSLRHGYRAVTAHAECVHPCCLRLTTWSRLGPCSDLTTASLIQEVYRTHVKSHINTGPMTGKLISSKHLHSQTRGACKTELVSFWHGSSTCCQGVVCPVMRLPCRKLFMPDPHGPFAMSARHQPSPMSEPYQWEKMTWLKCHCVPCFLTLQTSLYPDFSRTRTSHLQARKLASYPLNP